MTDSQFPPFGDDASRPPDPDATRQAVGTILARDPFFNLDAFLAEAQQAFWLVGQAHAKCKPELCLGVLSTALGERQRASIEKQCQEGRNVVPADGDADSGQLVSIASDSNHDTVIVHFSSTWKPVSGGKGNGDRRVENWCFQRPATAQTTQSGSGDRCRNCGAALALSAGATCRFCGTPFGDAAGWRVIRVDEVRSQEAESAVAAMQSIVANLATATRQGQTAPTPAPQPARKLGLGCLKPIFFVLLVLAGLGVYAVKGSGPVHNTVAKVVPSIRHAELKGPVDLSGPITAQQITATYVQAPLQPLGSCAQAAHRTAWDFKSKLPDGSTFHLKFSLPPGTSSPGPFKPPQLTLSATAKNASQTESWASTSTTPAVLTMTASGGADIKFSGLASARTGTTPLSGHLTWSCSLG